MAEIVPLPTRERCIWICACGSTSFSLHDDGALECQGCDKPVDPAATGQWQAPVRPPEEEPAEPRVMTSFRDDDFTLARFIDDLKRDNGDVVFFAMVYRSGRVRTLNTAPDGWSERPSEIWLDARLRDVRDQILGHVPMSECTEKPENGDA